MELREILQSVAGSRFAPDSKFVAGLAARSMDSLEMLNIKIDARGMSAVVLTGALIGFVCVLLPVYIFTSSPLLAPLIALMAALLFAYAVLALPQMLAARKVEKMERALPSYLSGLVSVYSGMRNMRAALMNSLDVDYGPLSAEVKEALVMYELTGDEERSFKRLTKARGARNVGAAFELITASLASGIDVSESLNLVARDSSSSLEANDEKNAKTGITTWSMASSSAFFFPLISAIGYDAMIMLESLNGTPIYSPAEKGLLFFTIVAYAFFAVSMDSMFIGTVRNNSMARGMATYFVPFAVIALAVIGFTIKFGSMIM